MVISNTLSDKSRYIPNKETQNNHFCRLQLVIETFGQFDEPTNQNSMKVPKVVKLMNKKTLFKTLGPSVTNNTFPDYSCDVWSLSNNPFSFK